MYALSLRKMCAWPRPLSQEKNNPYPGFSHDCTSCEVLDQRNNITTLVIATYPYRYVLC